MCYKQFLLTSSIALGLSVGGIAVADETTNTAERRISVPERNDVSPGTATENTVDNTAQANSSSLAPAQPAS